MAAPVAKVDDVAELHRRLLAAFGRPAAPARGDLLGRLIGTIIAQHTSATNARRALGRLRRRYPSWAGVQRAEVAEIGAAIECAGLARTKAPRIKALLEQIAAERGDLDLDFLAHLPVEAAMSWLRRLPGVGQTTAACVLLFALGRPVMPVDGGILRIARRLGLAGPRDSQDTVQAILEAGVAPGAILSWHVNLIRLGRELCRPAEPACPICPLNDRCAHFWLGRRPWPAVSWPAGAPEGAGTTAARQGR
jgi:endonuclease-3